MEFCNSSDLDPDSRGGGQEAASINIWCLIVVSQSRPSLWDYQPAAAANSQQCYYNCPRSFS